MFTGLITDIGEVRSVDRSGDVRFVIGTCYERGAVDIGASIAHSGACLTVGEKGEDWFAVDVSQETVDCTTLGAWEPGWRINLEQSLRLGAECGGTCWAASSLDLEQHRAAGCREAHTQRLLIVNAPSAGAPCTLPPAPPPPLPAPARLTSPTRVVDRGGGS